MMKMKVNRVTGYGAEGSGEGSEVRLGEREGVLGHEAVMNHGMVSCI